MKKEKIPQPELFISGDVEVELKPLFEHYYYKPSIFLGSWERHDLYFANVNGVPYLLDRSGNGSFQFYADEASKVQEDNESYLGNAKILAKKRGFI